MRIVSDRTEPGLPLPVKKLYLDGIVLESSCPTCGLLVKRYLGGDYLSFPRTGENMIAFNHVIEQSDPNTGAQWDDFHQWEDGPIVLDVVVSMPSNERRTVY